ncbi:N-alpha-acetyltransferase 16, NatA auxiliary subunit, partial [Rhizophlyctis rosea]
MAAAPKGRELGSKEASIFKTVLKFYEHKQYKKGLKSCEQILRKNPNHGETLAMKGLFLSNLDRKEEGAECIKLGVRNDMTSHICWHVYGLYHRGEKNYEQALKSYSHALKYDKENIQILRDYSMLQLQMRNYEGFSDATNQLLLLKPTNRQYWAGLAVSHHLLHKYDTAAKVLDSYEESLKDQTQGEQNIVEKYENSEMMLYKVMILEEGGEFDKALEALNLMRTKVLDQRGWKEARARIFLKSKKMAEAEVEYRKLLGENPDSVAYLEGLMASRGLPGDSDEAHEKLFRLLNELGTKYKRSHVIKRLPLNYAKGDRFTTLITLYLKEMFRKGVPSLFISMKDLYTSPEKSQTIESIVTNFATSLETSGQFPPFDAQENGEVVADEKEPPSAYLWVLYFLAQHYDWKRDSKRAMEFIEKAIGHTPTLVELWMTKARIFKHAGDPESAMKAMNDARELDLQDRNVNSKCTKYMLKNDRMAEAEKTITLFTRSESTDPLGDLVDMQCMWFALECAESHARKGEFGKALKRYHQIEKHFSDIYDDTFDFHSYAQRKMTLRAYLDLLRTDDKLRSHPYYFRAACGAIKIYLRLFDNPAAGTEEADAELANMSAEDRKKHLRKLRKAELQKQAQPEAKPKTAEAAPAEGASSGGGGGGKKDAKKVDPDPEGLKLVKDVDYLAEATKFVESLVELSPGRVEGWNLAGAIWARKGKLLLALKAIKKAHTLSPSDPDAHINLIRLYQSYTSQKSTLPPAVMTVLESEFPALFNTASSPDIDLHKFVKTYLDIQVKEKNVRGVVKGAEAVVLVDEGRKAEVGK